MIWPFYKRSSPLQKYFEWISVILKLKPILPINSYYQFVVEEAIRKAASLLSNSILTLTQLLAYNRKEKEKWFFSEWINNSVSLTQKAMGFAGGGRNSGVEYS